MRRISSRLRSDTPERLLTARDAVICDTPAILAISASVGGSLLAMLLSSVHSVGHAFKACAKRNNSQGFQPRKDLVDTH